MASKEDLKPEGEKKMKGAHAERLQGGADGTRPKGFPEYEFSMEQGSEEAWDDATFQEAVPVYTGHPEKEPKHLEGLV